MKSYQAKILVAGEAQGPVLVLREALSLWGGLEPQTGEIIDQRHPQLEEIVTGRMLLMPFGKGSSSASSILLEAVKAGTAPSAIVLAESDAILALGAVVAQELYGNAPPIVVLTADDYREISEIAEAENIKLNLSIDGTITRSEE
ncbi:MAG: DUF126 domain-containing protein [Chloroflexi bacterium]|nr:MAG: DUF126 domain-containing protein [Chloroflexota bacterium]MBL1195815.1 DUF126 domain-containing protein [Chloroflexota bacterium]NOH13107.1 DUF126 domain-containing protein [Chloroflexota bacterium]